MGLLNEQPAIVDYSIFGSSQQNNIELNYEAEAFNNSLRLWIASYEGDFIGKNTRGGYVMNALSKPMNSTETELVYASVYEGLTKDFRPEIEIINLTITPNPEKRRWEMELDYVVPSLNFRSNLRESLKGVE